MLPELTSHSLKCAWMTACSSFLRCSSSTADFTAWRRSATPCTLVLRACSYAGGSGKGPGACALVGAFGGLPGAPVPPPPRCPGAPLKGITKGRSLLGGSRVQEERPIIMPSVLPNMVCAAAVLGLSGACRRVLLPEWLVCATVMAWSHLFTLGTTPTDAMWPPSASYCVQYGAIWMKRLSPMRHGGRLTPRKKVQSWQVLMVMRLVATISCSRSQRSILRNWPTGPSTMVVSLQPKMEASLSGVRA
mmetsp:Transcript_3096/g.7750  ORF Transcript_3096/g.7750 Transcript_3096/m.7750 type:complete len:247 (+) Transcript_3096:1201-1941(+)